jgi:tetratricopeptide (TPR) repeat protein
MVLSRISFLEFGDASKDKAQGLKAVAHGREAYTMAEQFVAADPANVEALNDVMATAIALGQYLNELGDRAEARRLLEHGVSCTTELVQHDPGSRENQLNLAMAYDNLALSLTSENNLSAAIREKKKAAAIFERLSIESPNDVRILHPYTFNRAAVGELLGKQRDWQGAQQVILQGHQIAEAMDPKNPMFDEILGDPATPAAKPSGMSRILAKTFSSQPVRFHCDKGPEQSTGGG